MSPDPSKRFGRADVLGEVVGEALKLGGAVAATAAPEPAALPFAGAGGSSAALSLADEIAAQAPAASGNLSVDRVLAAALADTTEKWLISKGKLDYGPFSLADVDQADREGRDRRRQHHHGQGQRRARSTSASTRCSRRWSRSRASSAMTPRRAQAEVAVQSREKKRGALLYGVILLGVLGAAAAVFLIIRAARSDDDKKEIASIAAIDGASLKVTVSMPKAPPKKSGGSRGGTRRRWRRRQPYARQRGPLARHVGR